MGREASWGLRISLVLAVATYSTLQASIAPVLPEITRRFDSTPAEAAWLVSGFLITASVVPPIAGRVGDLIGHRRTLLCTLSIFLCGAMLAVFAHSMIVLILARMLQGFGAASISLGLSIAKSTFPPERIGGAVSMISTTMAVASGVGLGLSGVISTLLGLEAIFLLPFGIALIAGLLMIPQIRRDPPARPGLGEVNWWGAGLFSLGLSLLLLTITLGSVRGWWDIWTLACLGAGAGITAIWARGELRAGTPLIDLRLFRSRQLRRASGATLLLGACAFSVYNLVPMFLESGAGPGVGTAANGLMMLPISAGSLLAGTLSAALIVWGGLRRVFLLSSALNLLVVLGAFVLGAFVWGLMGLEFVHGAAIGFAYAALPALMMLGAPEGDSGVVAGMYNTLRSVGGAIGAQITFTIIAAGGAEPGAAAFVPALGFLVLLCVGALAVSFVLPRADFGRGA